MNNIREQIDTLCRNGNYRTLRPDLAHSGLIDLSSNDYLGLANNKSLLDKFLQDQKKRSANPIMSSSASRLLSLHQQSYINLEQLLSNLYKRESLVFNSGYHANSGIIPAICNKNTLIVCDKLVHASIIDGIILSRAKFVRFKHNDLNHLQDIIKKNKTEYSDILIITESVFSMDGDFCNLQELVDIKKNNPGVRLYVDEAHCFGVYGNKGLGLCEDFCVIDDIDYIIGTLGKAGASVGAFVITDNDNKNFLINTARSFIFSTMIPPFNCEWSQFIIKHIIDMNNEREHLHHISRKLNKFFISIGFPSNSNSQIVPLILKDAHKAISISQQLLDMGYIALPIRTPTVPIGTERIRFSLNSNIPDETIDRLITDLGTLL